jgi:hypothetical protein
VAFKTLTVDPWTTVRMSVARLCANLCVDASESGDVTRTVVLPEDAKVDWLDVGGVSVVMHCWAVVTASVASVAKRTRGVNILSDLALLLSQLTISYYPPYPALYVRSTTKHPPHAPLRKNREKQRNPLNTP